MLLSTSNSVPPSEQDLSLATAQRRTGRTLLPEWPSIVIRVGLSPCGVHEALGHVGVGRAAAEGPVGVVAAVVDVLDAR